MRFPLNHALLEHVYRAAGPHGRPGSRRPRLDQDSDEDVGGLARLPGLETVRDQLAARIAVLQVEQARRAAGAEIRRRAWKNLVFTGRPGTASPERLRLSPGTTGTWDCCPWGTSPK